MTTDADASPDPALIHAAALCGNCQLWGPACDPHAHWQVPLVQYELAPGVVSCVGCMEVRRG